ncbi:hypothetical protein B7435_07190 [Mycolicibacterium peregrinum]|uniref:hypothetical protein n=1 Tax=Mycolicibacterium peregrinum TaxID=43304 RepID=UPI000B4A608B|nr:hypothetical protein [Mycolicibacterium peregrinum]OWM07861.1 hypothetical protein B7435_07190 [Mycolicibacterium peregrinum]
MLKSDARRVVSRVQSHAAGMGLRGARRAVLAAVLELLPGRHSRITDDAVRLYQVADLIVEAGGRRYCDKTIGRALASLAADELVDYIPARGRGNRALVAIHRRFVDDVEVLQRDATGRVVVPETVTFSERHSSYRPKANYPPTPRSTEDQAASDSRPTGVEIHPDEVREVFAALPEAYQGLGTRTRWRLGGLIRRQLGRGWRPDQVIAILAAPMPGGVKSPLHLAMWRLAKNQPGSGPRLAPLQQAWDARAAAAERARSEQAVERSLAEVTEATTADQRDHALRAAAVRFGTITNPKSALVAAARAAARRFPGQALATALGRWAETILEERSAAAERPASIVPDLGVELAMSTVTGHCVNCQCTPGTIRAELPIPVPVCDTCWAANAEPEFEEDYAA